MDPQQRKLLEVVYGSFESARVRLEDVSDSNTACCVGNSTWNVGKMQARDVNHGAPYHMTVGLAIMTHGNCAKHKFFSGWQFDYSQ